MRGTIKGFEGRTLHSPRQTSRKIGTQISPVLPEERISSCNPREERIAAMRRALLQSAVLMTEGWAQTSVGTVGNKAKKLWRNEFREGLVERGAPVARKNSSGAS